MEANLQPSGKQIALAAKNPLAYMLIVCIGLLGTFVTLYYTSNNNNRADCQSEKLQLVAEKKALLDIILRQNAAFTGLRQNTDSVVRAKAFKHKSTKQK